MDLDQSVQESAAIIVAVLLLTIVVDCITADKELCLEIVIIRLFPGIITVGLIIKEALSLNTIVAWVTWVIVTAILYPLTHDLIEPFATALIALLILIFRYKMEN